MRDTPDSIEEIDVNDGDIGIHGVVFLLTSEEVASGGFTDSIKYRKWRRGL